MGNCPKWRDFFVQKNLSIHRGFESSLPSKKSEYMCQGLKLVREGHPTFNDRNPESGYIKPDYLGGWPFLYHKELMEVWTLSILRLGTLQWLENKFSPWMVVSPIAGKQNISFSILKRIPNMGVSKNRGTPKSSILIGFSIIHHPFWGTPIFGNTHILGEFLFWLLAMYEIPGISPGKSCWTTCPLTEKMDPLQVCRFFLTEKESVYPPWN